MLPRRRRKGSAASVSLATRDAIVTWNCPRQELQWPSDDLLWRFSVSTVCTVLQKVSVCIITMNFLSLLTRTNFHVLITLKLLTMQLIQLKLLLFTDSKSILVSIYFNQFITSKLTNPWKKIQRVAKLKTSRKIEEKQTHNLGLPR